MKLLARILPMRVVGVAFRDRVSGKIVYHCIELSGRWVMATSRWSLFRVPRE